MKGIVLGLCGRARRRIARNAFNAKMEQCMLWGLNGDVRQSAHLSLFSSGACRVVDCLTALEEA
eukprot:1986399-Amphidinium_carterae.1